MCDFFALYDCLCDNIHSDERILSTVSGDIWALAETEQHSGMAMHVHGTSRPAMLPDGLNGMPLRRVAEALKSCDYTDLDEDGNSDLTAEFIFTDGSTASLVWFYADGGLIYNEEFSRLPGDATAAETN